MKKILFLVLIMSSLNNYSQTYTTEAKALTGVFDVDGKSKAEIFSAINKWISINYNSGKSVTQLSDSEGGNIIIKGINESKYKNPLKIIYPNYTAEYSTSKFNHLIEINIKDNKYRIIYKLLENYMVDATVINDTKMINVNLDGSRKAEVEENMVIMEENFKKVYKNKEKREKLLEAFKLSFEEINTNLRNEMKTTMLSIQSAVTSTPTDGW